MCSMPVSKEEQTAYQRWELASLGNSQASVNSTKPKKEEAAVSDKIAKIFESVRQEAYEKGIKEGFVVGMAKAKEQANSERQQLSSLAKAFEKALETADETISENVLDLALDIAKAMLKTKLEVDSNVILPIVRDAMHYLPHVQKPARILVNHQDAKLLREYLAGEIVDDGWHIQEDSSIERGGCLVETGANQIDATNTMRWKRIVEALSQNNDWLTS